MKTRSAIYATAMVAATWLITASAAHASPLSVVNVAAPGVNCVFNTTKAPACQVIVEDSVGTFSLPGDTGVARLQSRTYPGVAPAPAAGDMAYVYRVDLTNVQGKNCVSTLTLAFGPVVPMPYSAGANSYVFVVTVGGLGTVVPAAADQVGRNITFTFPSPVCPGATSYFFGLASHGVTPVSGTARVSFSLGGGTITADRVP